MKIRPKLHREFLRMYSEMTLNRAVDCNTFVRVCRKFSFFHFTYGPHSKKVDRSAAEVMINPTQRDPTRCDTIMHGAAACIDRSDPANHVRGQMPTSGRNSRDDPRVILTVDCCIPPIDC